MKLSIIIPVLNEAQNIQRLLHGLQGCRQNGHELIVVDGGSTDATRELASKNCDVLLQSPAGRARQMNAGAQQASGDVLLFLHADTLLPDNTEYAVVNALQCGANWGRFDVRLSGTQRIFRLIERMMNWRSRASGIATGDQAMFVRRDVFQSVGGFADIPLMEDIALSKALKKQSPPACLQQQVITSSRRWEHFGVWRTILLMWRLRFAYFIGVSPEKLARDYRSH